MVVTRGSTSFPALIPTLVPSFCMTLCMLSHSVLINK
ncbi:hypothetical protein LINPERPRIM_LOCUS13081 [Linum perenne]